MKMSVAGRAALAIREGLFWPSRVHGQGGSFFVRPASMEPRPISGLTNSVISGPMPPKGSVRRQRDKTAIFRLSLGIGPSAVLWRIIAVYINPLYRKIVGIPGRNGPIVKCLKITPFITDRYPPASVIGEPRTRHSVTPSSHVLPNSVYSCSRTTVATTHAAGNLYEIASAGFGLTPSEVSTIDRLLNAAVTLASPNSGASKGIASLAQNQQTAKLLSTQIDEFWVLCHSLMLPRLTDVVHITGPHK